MISISMPHTLNTNQPSFNAKRPFSPFYLMILREMSPRIEAEMPNHLGQSPARTQDLYLKPFISNLVLRFQSLSKSFSGALIDFGKENLRGTLEVTSNFIEFASRFVAFRAEMRRMISPSSLVAMNNQLF